MKKRDYIKTAQDHANIRIWDFISLRYQSIARKNVFLGCLWIMAACVVFGCIAVIGWFSSFSMLFRDLRFTPHYLRTAIVSLRMTGEQATAFLDASVRDYKVRLAGINLSEYIRSVIRKSEVKQRLSSEHLGHIRQLSGMVNNINQIARNANAAGYAEACKE